MALIALVVGDTASGEFFTPVYPALIAKGHEVEVYADPDRNMVGGKVLQKAGIQVVPATELPNPKQFDLVVCGTTAKATMLVRNATVSAQESLRPVIWAGDLYGSGCEHHMLDLKPERLTAIDASAAEWIYRSRPDYPRDRVEIIGNPAFDRTRVLVSRRDELRGEVFADLGIAPKDRLIVLACSDSGQFAEDEMAKTINALGGFYHRESAVRVVMFHPADQRKEHLVKWVRNRRYGYGNKVISPDRLTGDPLADLIIADVAVVQYSLLGVQASLVVPTLFVMLRSMREYRMANGASWAEKFYPQIKHWAAMAAWDESEIVPALARLLGNEPGFHEAIQEAREKHFSSLTDGKATDRFMRLVHEVLNTGK